MNKKIIAMITTLYILGTSTMLFSTTANAKTSNDNNVKQEEKVKKDNNTKNPKISAKIAGVVVTARSGANLRTGAGMGYPKVGIAPYGAELSYSGTTVYDSQGNTWYSVDYNGRERWINSQDCLIVIDTL